MNCDNCKAEVNKTYKGSNGANYCCVNCWFHPLGCRCRFGELGVAEDTDYGQFDDEESEAFDEESEALHDEYCTCSRCWDWNQCFECGENLDEEDRCHNCEF